MKTKIVLWGENEKDEKILLGIELVEADNLIRIHVTPQSEATEIFYNQMMNQWREGQNVSMPEGTSIIDRPLSMTEGLLPDNIKTERQDILARAKTEWHFVILSSKLYESYVDEVQQIKERVAELSDFDGAIWEEMKTFWKKVQDQVQEKNLFREHAAELRKKTNELFDTLKSLKRAMNDEFEKESKEHVDRFFKKLDDIEARIEKGLGLQPIFNELKNVQSTFRDVKFTRKHHNDVWKRLDNAFKKVKEKRFGGKESGGNNSPVSRLTRRLDGLMSAINKMEQSIGRDDRDKKFQEKRIHNTDGQLELQIRQAKMSMIIERIKSKQVKLDDMLKTKGELESKLESEKVRAAKKEEKAQQAKDLKKAKAAVKDDIAKQIETSSEALKEKEAKLEKAAAAIKKAKARKQKTPPVADNSADKEVPIKESPAEEESDADVSAKEAIQSAEQKVTEISEETTAPVPVTEASQEAPKVQESPEVAEESIVEVSSAEAVVEEVVEEKIIKAAEEIEVVYEEVVAPVEPQEVTEVPAAVVVEEAEENISEATSEIMEEIKEIGDSNQEEE